MTRTLLLPLALLLCVQTLSAQDGFRLKRTKKESTPLNAQIFGGYNGMSDPSELLQHMFEHTNRTSWGGVMLGMQVAVEIDTVFGKSFWGGLEGYYHRMARRWLADAPGVSYPDSDELVEHEEELDGYGGNLFLAYGPIWMLTLQVGGGIQYQVGRVSTSVPIIGLFEAQTVPTVFGGILMHLLSYDHGSIDANFRGVKGFGDYGSFQFQSLLCFNFRF